MEIRECCCSDSLLLDRPFQEGNGSAERLLAGTSGNGGSVLDESLTGRPSSTGGAGDDSGVSSLGDNNTRLRNLLSHPESGSDLSSDNPNKILKDLLNQKDEDDGQGMGSGGEGNNSLERLISHVPSHHDYKPHSCPSPSVNSTNNNMLRTVRAAAPVERLRIGCSFSTLLIPYY